MNSENNHENLTFKQAVGYVGTSVLIILLVLFSEKWASSHGDFIRRIGSVWTMVLFMAIPFLLVLNFFALLFFVSGHIAKFNNNKFTRAIWASFLVTIVGIIGLILFAWVERYNSIWIINSLGTIIVMCFCVVTLKHVYRCKFYEALYIWIVVNCTAYVIFLYAVKRLPELGKILDRIL